MKKEYETLLAEAKALIDRSLPLVSNLSNLSACLNRMGGLNWCGFYLARKSDDGDALFLGPFQGEVACTKIPFGKGVCGKAAAEGRSIVVPDVLAFPGHIACSSLSRSEIVVPILRGSRVLAVIDMDAPTFSRFDDEIREALEAVAALIEPLFD